MTQKSALIIAAGVTAFMLVFFGALAAYVTQSKPSAASAAQQSPVAETQPDPVQTMQAVLDAREAAYKQQLTEANRRIEEANNRLKQLYDRFGTPVPQSTSTPEAAQPLQPVQFTEPTPTTPASPSYPVSPNDAALTALRLVTGASLTSVPDLVSFRGTAAYEVHLDRGNVYVDAASGQVLYNDAAVAPVAPEPAPVYQDNSQEGDD